MVFLHKKAAGAVLAVALCATSALVTAHGPVAAVKKEEKKQEATGIVAKGKSLANRTARAVWGNKGKIAFVVGAAYVAVTTSYAFSDRHLGDDMQSGAENAVILTRKHIAGLRTWSSKTANSIRERLNKRIGRFSFPNELTCTADNVVRLSRNEPLEALGGLQQHFTQSSNSLFTLAQDPVRTDVFVATFSSPVKNDQNQIIAAGASKGVANYRVVRPQTYNLMR